MPKFDVYYSTVDIDEDEILDYVKRNYGPSEVFDDSDLDEWAIDHDYIKQE